VNSVKDFEGLADKTCGLW